MRLREKKAIIESLVHIMEEYGSYVSEYTSHGGMSC